MARCGIHGEIPTQIGNLKNLTLLALMDNRLSGPFPDVLSSLSKIERMYIDSNQFTGPISREQWAFLGQRDYAPLYRNRFTGQLPDDIGEIFSDKAKVFDVEGNQFSGTIPSSLALLSGLEWLDLSNNLFTGTIPENLTASDTLALHGNNFTGAVPDSVCEGVNGQGGTIMFDCDGPLSCDCNCACAGDEFS